MKIIYENGLRKYASPESCYLRQLKRLLSAPITPFQMGRRVTGFYGVPKTSSLDSPAKPSFRTHLLRAPAPNVRRASYAPDPCAGGRLILSGELVTRHALMARAA
jgi:hypothetical protein